MAGARLASRFKTIRAHSVALTEGLEVEDFMVQSMPDASPPRWHLAHTTWFFETFVLRRWRPEVPESEPLYR